MGIADFKIVERQQMNERELGEVRELERICNAHEGLTLKLNWGMLQERKSGSGEDNDFLCYSDEGKLVGFLALYGFGRPEIEVSGMVHPEYRLKGVFSFLIERAMEKCRQREIKSFLFICGRNSESGRTFLRDKAAVYDHSEHRMELPGDMKPLELNSPVELRTAGYADYDMMAELDAICFDMPVEESKNFYDPKTLLSVDQMFVAVVNTVDIGMIKLFKENDEMYIFGFGIKPEFRGKGYGRATLAKAVNIALAGRPARVSLEVDCINDTALNLYKSCGFQTTATYDYFRLPI